MTNTETPAPAARLAWCADPECATTVDLDQAGTDTQHGERLCPAHGEQHLAR